MTRRVIAYVTDLMDRSRLTSAAEPAGIELVFVRSAAKLVEAMTTSGTEATTVVIDLGRPDALDAVEAARAGRVVAFGAHVDTDRLHDARRAGAATVLARSAFFSDPARWMGG
jgi:hypothetical protein